MQKFTLKLVVIGVMIFLFAACSKKTTQTSNSNQGTVSSRTQQDKPQKGDRPQRGERPQFADLLSRMDANKDGKLAQSELQGRMKENFSKMDSNGDGFISEAEFKNAPRPQRGGRRN